MKNLDGQLNMMADKTVPKLPSSKLEELRCFTLFHNYLQVCFEPFDSSS